MSEVIKVGKSAESPPIFFAKASPWQVSFEILTMSCTANVNASDIIHYCRLLFCYANKRRPREVMDGAGPTPAAYLSAGHHIHRRDWALTTHAPQSTRSMTNTPLASYSKLLHIQKHKKLLYQGTAISISAFLWKLFVESSH